MPDRIETNRPARTTVDISGACIPTIPAGTEFMITWYDDPATSNSSRPSSVCGGLAVNLIWNDEFEFIGDDNA